MPVIACVMAVLISLWNVPVCGFLGVETVTESSSADPWLWIRKIEDAAEANRGTLCVGLQDPPVEGFAAVIMRLSCSENGQIACVVKENLLHAMTLSYRVYEGGAVILLDAAENVQPSEMSALVSVTVEGEGTVRICVESATVYGYRSDDDTFNVYPLFPVETHVVFVSNNGSEAVDDKHSVDLSPPMWDQQTPVDGMGSASSPSVYVGCQETESHQGKFSVRFLFLSCEYPWDAGAYIASSTGNARVTVEIHAARDISEWCSGGLRIHATAGDERWYMWIFSDLSDKESYVFSVICAEKTAVIRYRQGRFEGQYLMNGAMLP